MSNASVDANADANANANATSNPILSFSLLDMIQEAQNQHGLRHQDYESYRRYCSHKLARLARHLRTSLKLRKTCSSPAQKLTLAQDEPLDVTRLQYFLFELERDWALTHSLKQKGSEHNSRVSAHIRKRAKKLFVRSQALHARLRLATDKLLLELVAYTYHMIGYACMLLKDWALSLTALDAAMQYYALFCPHHPIDEVKSIFKYVQRQSGAKEAAALRSPEEQETLEQTLAHFSSSLRRSDLRIEWAGKSILVTDPALTQPLGLAPLDVDYRALLKAVTPKSELHSYLLFKSQTRKILGLLQASEKAGSLESYLQGGLNARRRAHFRWTRAGHAKKIIKILEAMKNDPILKENLSMVKGLESRMVLFSIERAVLQALHLKKADALPLLKNIQEKLAVAKKESERLSVPLTALDQSDLERERWQVLMHATVQLIDMLSGQVPNTLTRAHKSLVKKSNRAQVKTKAKARAKAKTNAKEPATTSATVFYDAQAQTHGRQMDSEDEQDAPSPAPPASSTSSISGLLKRWWSGSPQ